MMVFEIKMQRGSVAASLIVVIEKSVVTSFSPWSSQCRARFYLVALSPFIVLVAFLDPKDSKLTYARPNSFHVEELDLFGNIFVALSLSCVVALSFLVFSLFHHHDGSTLRYTCLLYTDDECHKSK